MDTRKIEALLAKILDETPDGSTLALVIIAPDRVGGRAGTVVESGMNDEELKLAARCLAHPGDGTPLGRWVH